MVASSIRSAAVLGPDHAPGETRSNGNIAPVSSVLLVSLLLMAA